MQLEKSSMNTGSYPLLAAPAFGLGGSGNPPLFSTLSRLLSPFPLPLLWYLLLGS